MGELRAKVKFKKKKDAKHLRKAFLKEATSESSITIGKKGAELRIVFQDPPMAIIEALERCKVIEFKYEKVKTLEQAEEEPPEQPEEEVKEEEPPEQPEEEVKEEELLEQPEEEVKEEEPPEQPEEEVKEEETPEQPEEEIKEEEPPEQPEEEVKEEELLEQPEEEVKEEEPPEQPKEEVKTEKGLSKSNIPELDNIARKATSFENFVKLVAEWLGMGKYTESFEQLAIVSTEVSNICWKELEKGLQKKCVIYTQTHRVETTTKVRKKSLGVTLIPFLKAIAKYKEYPFNQNAQGNLEISKEEEVLKPRIRMTCMPEIKHFEEVLASVDKTKPIEERVCYVLEAMELRKQPIKEQKWIFEIVNTAIRTVKDGKISWNIICVKTNISIEHPLEARMVFSNFLNHFVQKYKENEIVKVADFLLELQNIIMLESEIRDSLDFA